MEKLFYRMTTHPPRGRASGRQNAVENARNLLAMNVLTSEQIAQGTVLPLEQVLELQKELAATTAQA